MAEDQRDALWKKASVEQETAEQHLAGYRQRVEFIEMLLDQLNEGTAKDRPACHPFEWQQQKHGKLYDRVQTFAQSRT